MNQIEQLEIPDSVIFIGSSAFEQNFIKHLKFGKGLKEISPFCFHLNDLTHITIPSNVKVIDDNAFSCNRLESVSLEDGVEELREYSFSDNRTIRSIKIPPSVKFIGSGSFDGTPIKCMFLERSEEKLSIYDCISVQKVYVFRNLKYNRPTTELLHNAKYIYTTDTKNMIGIIGEHISSINHKPNCVSIDYGDALDQYEFESIF